MAVNDGSLQDEDGDTPDWIELYNASGSTVNLVGWYLTDRIDKLDRWAFPSVSLAPGGYLVVFASSKDRRNPASELHTDFKLSGDGEYLALVRPDLSVEHDYAPTFPPQEKNVSFGMDVRGTPLLVAGDPAILHVPTDGSIGTEWHQPGYVMTQPEWFGGATGVGFGMTEPGLAVKFIKSSVSLAGAMSAAEAVLQDVSQQTYSSSVVAPVINYFNSGSAGHFAPDETFPTLTIGSDADWFLIEVTGAVNIPSAGWWTFGVNSDDGFSLDLERGSEVFHIEFPTNRGPSDTLGPFNVVEPGWYEVRLLYWENGGGAEVEFFAAQGLYSGFDAGAFRLVGDTAGGGLETRTPVGGAGGSGISVETDLGVQMLGNSPSAYLRLPFNASVTNDFDALLLHLHYNDGFAAYLNGIPVASAQAPASPAWNTPATAARSMEDTLAVDVFDLSSHLDLLVSGQNWLTVHGMNVSAADANFLVQPELFARGTLDTLGFFAPATPGGENGQPYVFGTIADTKFSVDRGFYTNAFDVALSCATDGAQIRYTLDGSAPTETAGQEYTTPLTIDETTVLRAAAFKTGYIPSDIDTMTYIFTADVVQQTLAATIAKGFPTSWSTTTPDYGMDPNVIGPGDSFGGVYAATILDDLQSVPSVSLVADLNDIFGPAGFYANPTMTGAAWERACSAELIDPNGLEKGFHVNCGIRIQGGAFRNWGLTKKKSFRLLFKNQYGPGKLNYPLFGDEGADDFNTFTLRSEANDGYAWGGHAEVLYLRDQWARETQAELGQAASRGRSVHVYLNGVYWGLYNLVERPDQGFGSSYFDVDKELWDGVNSGAAINSDGDPARQQRTMAAWNTMRSLTQAVNNAPDEASRSAALLRVQGLNPDGSNNPAWESFVDIDSLIDYYIVNLYGGNDDWPSHNWYAGRDNVPHTSGWKFFCWDTERIMDLPKNKDVFSVDNTQGPGAVLNDLRPSAEFRLRFADRLHRAFFNGGPLYVDPSASQWNPAQPERNRPAARLMNLVDRVRSPLVAESARWGDQHREPPYTVRSEFDAEVNYLLQSYFPTHSAVALQRFRDANLYPDAVAPTFTKHGGLVTPGFALGITAPAGTVYYTLDGSDPRLPGGAANPDALTLAGNSETQTLVPKKSYWRYLDNGTDQGTAWQASGFNDTSWSNEPGVFGYGDAQDTIISYGPNDSSKYITTYFRKAFLAQDPGSFQTVTLGLRRDDGAVVYLNGQELFRDNMPQPPADIDYQTPASSVAGGSEETTYYTHNVDPGLLVDGVNYLAVEVHQISGSSSDLTFDLELVATTASNGAEVPIPVSGPVQARVWNGSEWSALTEATFVLDEPMPLQVSELMIHARLPEGGETNLLYAAEDYEWVELLHTGTSEYGLAGVEWSQGIDFRFEESDLRTVSPGERILVVANEEAFQARYPGVDPARIAGRYTGSLNNGGETLRYGVPLRVEDVRVPYGSGREWPLKAAGAGHALVPQRTDPDDLEYGPNWEASAYRDGSPGAANPAPFIEVLFNELAAHTDYSHPSHPEYDSNDWIELYNAGSGSVSLGPDWFLSDDVNNLRKVPMASANLAPGAWLDVDEINDFHTPITSGFGLDKAGERLYLSYLPGTDQDRVADAVRFKGQENGRSLGRYPDGTSGFHTLFPTRGGANQMGPPELRISEIMFHPSPSAAYPEDNQHGEYIELFNPTGSPVQIDGWRLADDVGLVFPVSTQLGAGETLVAVSFDPTNTIAKADFLTAYDLYEGDVSLVGPWKGNLSNRGGRVALERPQAPDLPGDLPSWVIVDEMFFFDRYPWSSTADATGQSLHDTAPGAPATDGSAWQAAVPSPGALAIDPHDAALQIQRLGGGRLLSWDPLPGVPYQLEESSRLVGADWSILGTIQTNGPTFWMAPPTGSASRCFRLTRPE